VISLAFWISLLAAALLYAAVALSPKYLSYLELRSRYYAGQIRLVRLEKQVHYLQRVEEVLETDAEFAAELARSDFGASGPGEERIPVDPELRLDGEASPAAMEALPHPALPWHTPLVRAMATNARLREGALVVAVALTLVAFTFLHESQEDQIRSGVKHVKDVVSTAWGRYRKRDRAEE
jgi:hypothetical protein